MWNNYKGSLPYHQKDQSILPYKYSFNVENFEIKNYYTEKLIDGILGETLVFYHGCPNIKDLIDERAYVSKLLLNRGATALTHYPWNNGLTVIFK